MEEGQTKMGANATFLCRTQKNPARGWLSSPLLRFVLIILISQQAVHLNFFSLQHSFSSCRFMSFSLICLVAFLLLSRSSVLDSLKKLEDGFESI